MKHVLFTLIFISSVLSLECYSQDYSEEAKAHFGQYLDSKSQTEMIVKSLPSLEDCKLIFQDKSAYTFYGFVEEMKSSLPDDESNENEVFADCRIETFTTYDIKDNKGNYAGGMKEIVDQIQSNVTFYRVTYLREKDAEAGVSYNYFVNIKGNWVFIPKPWRVLR